MRHKIFVTKKHIKKGKRRKMLSCPIALALKQKFKDQEPEVSSEEVALWSNGDQQFYTLPQKAQKFVEDFDEGKKVKPFIFCLNIKENV